MLYYRQVNIKGNNMPEKSNIDEQIKKGIEVLEKGGIVAFPTDTVYSLGALITNKSAIERVFEIKGRDKTKALPVLVADASQMKEYALKMPDIACRLSQRFLPGALTLVLPKTSLISDEITGGAGTVALRIPDNEIALALIKGVGMPITGTSANLSGERSTLTAEEVKGQIGDKVDYIIDGGRVKGGLESTIVDFSGDKPNIIRQGSIPKSELELFCNLE